MSSQNEAQTTETANKKPSWKQSFKNPQFKKTIARIIGLLFKSYPVALIVAFVCTLVNIVVSILPAVFMQKALTVIEQNWATGNWAAAEGPILQLTYILGLCFAVGILAGLTSGQLMATITQGTLMNIRNKLFGRMETLPISYFDTHEFGDIMSHYTNDVDALRQLISNSLMGVITGCIGIVGVVFLMLYYSIWMTIVIVLGSILMFAAMGYLGARSGKFFKAQQEAIGVCEGFVEETMAGQRTIKVFTHEKIIESEFDQVNDKLYEVAHTANSYSNVMPPVLFNIGNVLYVFVALAASIFIYLNIPNASLSGAALTIATAVPFLNMTKQLTSQAANIARSVNPLILGVAGAQRVFELMDEKPEEDHGYVTLVNVCEKDGELVECAEKTCKWAWKHPHADGSVTYTPLKGHIQFEHVDFGYNPDHIVLHDISLYAEPGQKVAFVGATGAGKTTITNLLNRFYEIQKGKIRYDGINIEKIKKPDLRHSLGMVLQDTNLFSTSVMENIRFGNLDATAAECIEASKLAGADSFVTRLPEGYETPINNNGSNLSEGQKQLLSIARAAVANPPVMILDEATSSIDTRTEALVQRGMDNLMHGRTTFIIAHRLSTVRNSDVICVLDHGRIIERGSHDELIAKHGYYYQLYTGNVELD